jgi:hypothetical protein
MRKLIAAICFTCLCSPVAAQSPTPSTSPEELAKHTELLKSQQAYYDQLLATLKAQQAAATVGLVNATSAQTLLTQLRQAEMTGDLAMSAAIKGSGLTAATGKSGGVSLAAAAATLLPLQRGGLMAIDNLADQVCKDLKANNIADAFIAPATFEALAQKGVVDVIQLRSLHQAAIAGAEEFKAVQLQMAGTSIAGALVSAEYLAGGIQALSKLFRNDYSVAVSTNSRSNLFEQRLAAACGHDTIAYNMEGVLRLNGAAILTAWLPDMASFVQLYETSSEQITAQVTALNAQRTAIAADTTLTTAQKNAAFDPIDQQLKAFEQKQLKLAKYKAVSGAIKAYLAALAPTSTVFDSIVWSQDVLFDLGGLPASLTAPRLNERPRFAFTLNVQDAAVTKSSAFSADQVKGVTSVEAYYSVFHNSKLTLSGVYTETAETPTFNFSKSALPSYTRVRAQDTQTTSAAASSTRRE